MPWALTCCVASQLSGSASTCATTSRASVSLGRSNHTASTAKLASTTLAASAHWRQAGGGLPERRGAMSGGRQAANDAQLIARTEQPRQHRGGGQRQLAGDLLGGKTAHHLQDERLAILDGQSHDGMAQRKQLAAGFREPGARLGIERFVQGHQLQALALVEP